MKNLQEQIQKMRKMTNQLEGRDLSENLDESWGKNLAAGLALGAASLVGGQAAAQQATPDKAAQSKEVTATTTPRKVDTLSSVQLGRALMQAALNDQGVNGQILTTLGLEQMPNDGDLGTGSRTQQFQQRFRNRGGEVLLQDLNTCRQDLENIVNHSTKHGFLTPEGRQSIEQEFTTLGDRYKHDHRLSQLAEEYLVDLKNAVDQTVHYGRH